MSWPLLYSGMRVLFFHSSLNFLYSSSVLGDVPVDDLVSLLLVYEAPHAEVLTEFCLGSDREAVLVEVITRQMLLRMARSYSTRIGPLAG